MPDSRYSRDEHEAYFKMLNVIGTRWEDTLRRPDYRNSTAWNLLTKLWREERVKMSIAYEYMRDVKSPTTRRVWMQKAIADGLIECSDENLVHQLRSGSKNPVLPRGVNSPEVWLNPMFREQLDSFLDDVIDDLIRTADFLKMRERTVSP